MVANLTISADFHGILAPEVSKLENPVPMFSKKLFQIVFVDITRSYNLLISVDPWKAETTCKTLISYY